MRMDLALDRRGADDEKLGAPCKTETGRLPSRRKTRHSLIFARTWNGTRR